MRSNNPHILQDHITSSHALAQLWLWANQVHWLFRSFVDCKQPVIVYEYFIRRYQSAKLTVRLKKDRLFACRMQWQILKIFVLFSHFENGGFYAEQIDERADFVLWFLYLFIILCFFSKLDSVGGQHDKYKPTFCYKNFYLKDKLTLLNVNG